MKFSHYKKRVEESKEFKQFKEKNKKSYLAAGFFVLDYDTDKHSHQIDYALPDGRIATFNLDEGINLKISDKAIKNERKALPEIKDEANTDLDMLKGIVEDEMKNRVVTDKIKKIIAILHINDNKLIWNLQCLLDGLGILNVHVDDFDKSVLKFEKHSMMDLIKVIPNQFSRKNKESIKLNEKDIKKLEEQINKQMKESEKQPKQKAL